MQIKSTEVLSEKDYGWVDIQTEPSLVKSTGVSDIYIEISGLGYKPIADL